MILQKTGWRIKQFISHRRNGSFDDSNDECISRSVSANPSRRGSWLSQNPIESSTIRRASVSTTISTASRKYRPPPLPTATAYSSASSLCSCDCPSNVHLNAGSLSEISLATSNPEILYLPQLPLVSGDAKTWKLIFSEKVPRSPYSHSSQLDQEVKEGEATFDLLEALAIDPVDHDKTPTQSIRNTKEFDMEKTSGELGQLVRETDEAFQAVGVALADVKAASPEWFEKDVSAPFTHTTMISRAAPGTKTSYATPKTIILRSKSTKVNRKPFYRRNAKASKKAAKGVQTTSNAVDRWTLTEVTTNLVDVFSGKLFRTEVDEMLTPGRMQRLKNDIRIETDRRKASFDTIRTTETDGSTPTEPFHLESLSALIDASLQATNPPFPSPILPPPPVPKKSERRVKGRPTEIKVTEAGMVFEDLSFPSPPRKSKVYRGAPPLPTIPEISPIAFTPPLAQCIKATGTSTPSGPVANRVTFYSTPFTLTSPLFRHGDIRIDKETVIPDEEALDWTAFQMAISGTMDEHSDTSDDVEWELEEAELDDTIEWFESFGWDGPGNMIREAASKERTQVYMQEQERIWGRANRGKNIEGDLKESRAWSTEDIRSLPSSPLLDLTPKINRNTIIPMGYNLAHDVGDFLNWEAQHIQSLYDTSK